MTGVSHIAVNTADLDRFRSFYEGLLGLPVGIIVRMDHPPHLRHATFHVTNGLVIHAFEVPGYDPQAQGIGIDIGERPRIDHFGFTVPDEPTLQMMAKRLRATGATNGEIRPLGPVLSLHITDPDGLQLEINCPDPTFDLDSLTEEIEEIGLPDWLPRMQAAALSSTHP